jgi:hypothetical protein
VGDGLTVGIGEDGLAPGLAESSGVSDGSGEVHAASPAADAVAPSWRRRRLVIGAGC